MELTWPVLFGASRPILIPDTTSYVSSDPAATAVGSPCSQPISCKGCIVATQFGRVTASRPSGPVSGPLNPSKLARTSLRTSSPTEDRPRPLPGLRDKPDSQKRQRDVASSAAEQLSDGLPAAKRQKQTEEPAERRHHRSSSFWDQLSKVPLCRAALREFDRRAATLGPASSASYIYHGNLVRPGFSQRQDCLGPSGFNGKNSPRRLWSPIFKPLDSLGESKNACKEELLTLFVYFSD